jgi:hypothetical protein
VTAASFQIGGTESGLPLDVVDPYSSVPITPETHRRWRLWQRAQRMAIKFCHLGHSPEEIFVSLRGPNPLIAPPTEAY